MALLEADFAKGIEGFVSAWRASSIGVDKYSGDGGRHGDWDDVRVAEKFGIQYMQITRQVSAPTEQAVKNSDGEIYESEDEIEIEDEDLEALSRPAAASSSSSSAAGRGLDCMVRYDVVYSTSYQVPVLYLTFADASTSKNIPLPSADEVYDMLVPQGFKASMRDVGVMGALSMAEHPITGMPAYFVHPCRTQEALTPLLAGASQTAGTEPAVEYLLLWFGVIGASVGLSVPVHTASLIAERRGEATELGRC